MCFRNRVGGVYSALCSVLCEARVGLLCLTILSNVSCFLSGVLLGCGITQGILVVSCVAPAFPGLVISGWTYVKKGAVEKHLEE